mmetsp:Transcript_118569/g.206506  ORF Transcript_118569/g.206506 Transcript_118569/m.206506 type:complete len:307 (-) Transcript_118569:659-1579(-)
MENFASLDWKCRTCGSNDIVEDHSAGDLVCRNCGLVAAERICQEGEDERHFESDDFDRKHNEVANELTDGWDMSTRIRHNGSSMAAELRTSQRASKDDNGQMRCFMEIDGLSNKVPGGVPTACKEKAKSLAKLYLEKCANTRGKRLKAISAASLYISLTRFEERANINYTVMAEHANLEFRVLTKYVQKMEDQLKECGHVLPSKKKRDFVGMYIDALGLPYPMKALCDKIYAKALKLQECNGKNPETVVAAVILFCCKETENNKTLKGEKVTVEKISQVSGSVAASTITGCYIKDLSKYRSHLLGE